MRGLGHASAYTTGEMFDATDVVALRRLLYVVEGAFHFANEAFACGCAADEAGQGSDISFDISQGSRIDCEEGDGLGEDVLDGFDGEGD